MSASVRPLSHRWNFRPPALAFIASCIHQFTLETSFTGPRPRPLAPHTCTHCIAPHLDYCTSSLLFLSHGTTTDCSCNPFARVSKSEDH
mmetsp:Transcript_8285/g.5922  ORF Transcript_8285/g.5922 Transcript_8285/m.5922 type:complete len:89 (-) Transcript_8285:40-306(-)